MITQAEAGGAQCPTGSCRHADGIDKALTRRAQSAKVRNLLREMGWKGEGRELLDQRRL